ncbi:MAG: excinuclease ABC subunit C [Candidatus Margulisbacteria bacterium GWF2_35_9]|nr:MAG: excinuclease ABC subunit C [Candidatus Margulisbacteria bacterium GWF2_35_9]
MKSQEGIILYVGKAINLRNRVSSYFKNSTPLAPKIKLLVSQIYSIDYVVTTNESEALFLENQYIKEYQPKYNTKLKDNKTYPYIKISMRDPFPKVVKTRLKIDDGSLYFGPYVSTRQLTLLLTTIKNYFGIRRCQRINKKTAPCLYYHMNLCTAPCINKISEKDYKKLIKDIILLLEGNYKNLLRELTQQMQEKSAQLEFESAQKYKDKIAAINTLMENQRVENLSSSKNYDLFVFLQYNTKQLLQIFRIKKGYLVQNISFDIYSEDLEENENKFINSICQFYQRYPDYPDYIVYDEEINSKSFKEYMTNKGIKLIPVSEWKDKDLYIMVRQNAYYSLKRELEVKEDKDYNSIAIQLKDDLKLRRLPKSIIGIDISHLSGKQIVASMIYFLEGIPQKNQYRKFDIKTVPDNDDYASIREVVFRVFKRIKQEANSPDLVLIDGGRGQLNAAMDSLDKLQIEDQDILSLAKKEEIIYLPLMKEGIRLDEDNDGLKLLQQVRDEAHRFAVGFQRFKRKRIFK